MEDITEYLYNKVGIPDKNDFFARTSLESGTTASRIEKAEIRKLIVGISTCFIFLVFILTAITSHGIHHFTYKNYEVREYFTQDYVIHKVEPLCETELEDHTVYHLKEQYRLYDIFNNMNKLAKENFVDTVIAPYLGKTYFYYNIINFTYIYIYRY